MDRNYDNKSIENILLMLNRFVHNSSNQNLFINVDITTTEGTCKSLKLSNNENNIIEVNKNIIVYNNTAISLKDVVKIKFSIKNIDDNNLKNILYKNLKNTILDRSRNNQIRNQNPNRIYNYKSEEYNIENYIQRNHDKIKKVSYNGITNEDILSTNTTVDVYKENIIKDININLRTSDVVNSIEHSDINVVTDINTDKIEVLTNDAKEIEVSKPIKTEKVEVVSDLDISPYNIMLSQESTTAVKDIKENISKAITSLDIENINSALVNVNEKQIENSKKIDILEIEPYSKFINKNELNNKELIVDPTGERYVGVVLDDGTFEPVKIKLKTYNVLQDNTLNYISNIDVANQLKTLVSKVTEYTKDFIEKIQIEYNNDLVEYNSNTVNLNDIIKVYKQKINNVLNTDDTAYVITKDKTQTINNINNIDSTTISKIDKLNVKPVVDNINVDIEKKDIISDIDFNKFNNNKVEEYINGNISLVSGGIMVVEEDDDIVIYSTAKIKSVN